MFQRATDDFNRTSATQQKSLQQQLFPSSSPNAQDASQKPQNLTSPTSPRRALNPIPKSRLNQNDCTITPANCGVKRTHSGLTKVLGSGGRESFQDMTFAPPPTSLPPKGAAKSPPTPSVEVYFDENDFDSDPELEVENLATKPSISYPRLPPQPLTAAHPKSIHYPSIQKAEYHTQVSGFHTQPSRDPGYSSGPLVPRGSPPPPPSSGNAFDWSSSPEEHQHSTSGRNPLAQYAYSEKNDGNAVSKPAQDNGQRPQSDAGFRAPIQPGKRRTLPWLEEQSRQAQQETYSHSISSSNQRSTPASKSKSPYPWNTTASAIKEQQKQLRRQNKKAIKTGEGTEESRSEALKKQKSDAIALPGLSAEQRRVLDLIVDSKKSVFFTGSAGTGKSVLLRETIRVLRRKFVKEPDRIAITASTGLAACNIGGVTLHSFAGIGLGKEDVPELVKKIKRNQKAKHRWLRTKVLIIDEISMVDGELFDKLEAIGRTLRNNGRPFGGIQLVATGDFFQLPPVPDSSIKAARFAFDATTWSSSIDHTIGLHHVFRQKDPAFASMLNEMREGRLSQDSINAFRKLNRPLDFFDNLQATELFPTRGEVDAANGMRMRQLAGAPKIFQARDGGSIVDKSARDRLLASCMAPEVLELKKGSQVMLIKNIDETLVNGSLGKVAGFMNEAEFDSYNADPEAFLSTQAAPDDDLNPAQLQQKQRSSAEPLTNTTQVWPLVRFTLADGTTRDLLCNRETWKVELPSGEVQASRAQIPLILAWALSIHKAQGQTLERVKVDLGKVFENGQAYVALSRATTTRGLQVLRFDPGKVTAHKKVRDFYAGLSRAEMAGEYDDDDGTF